MTSEPTRPATGRTRHGFIRWVRPGHVPLAASATLVAALALLPITFVIGQTVSVGLHGAMVLLVRPRVGTLLLNTAELVVLGTAACTVVGVAAAWLVERTDLPARKTWITLLGLPLVVPAFVRSFGWISLLPSVHGLDGALLIVTLSYYPLVFLPVRAAFQGLDPALEECARSTGAGRWRCFVRVSLPQVRGALLGGALLVALDLLAEFGAFSMLRFATFTTAIYDQYRAAFDSPAGALLGLVLVTLCAPLLGLELLLRGRSRHDRIGPGVQRPAPRHQLGRVKPLALGGVVAMLILSVGVPIGSIGYWLSRPTRVPLPLGDLISATTATLSFGFTSAIVALIAAFPIAFLTVRRRSVFAISIERAAYLSHALPGIIVALALITVSIRVVPATYQSRTLLITGYVILFLPRALIALRSALEKAPPALEEAAQSLGNRPLATLGRVTVPLIAPGIGAGGALVFLSVSTELTTTLLLAPIGTQTLATGVWIHTSNLAYAAAAPYAALIIIATVPTMLLLGRWVGPYQLAAS
jgi:iron(III) transport system permease protein